MIEESKLSLPGPMTQPVLMQLPTPDGAKLPAILIRPNSASEANRCAVVVEVYGGPQAPRPDTK